MTEKSSWWCTYNLWQYIFLLYIIFISVIYKSIMNYLIYFLINSFFNKSIIYFLSNENILLEPRFFIPLLSCKHVPIRSWYFRNHIRLKLYLLYNFHIYGWILVKMSTNVYQNDILWHVPHKVCMPNLIEGSQF